MGIKINGIKISKDREIEKQQCPYCDAMVATINHSKHVLDCDLNPNKKNK